MWGREEGGGVTQPLQSVLNGAVLCVCDCRVGHYFLIRALFPWLSDWGSARGPVLPACLPACCRRGNHRLLTLPFCATHTQSESLIGPQPTPGILQTCSKGTGTRDHSLQRERLMPKEKKKGRRKKSAQHVNFKPVNYNDPFY